VRTAHGSRVVSVAIGSAVALLLAGCTATASAPASTSPVASPSPSPRTSLAPDAALADADGRQRIEIGDAAIILGDAGRTIGSITLLQVTRDVVCDSSIDEPAVNDGFIGLRFEVVTEPNTPEYQDEQVADLDLSAEHLWGYTADGTFIPDIVGTGYLCSDDAIGPHFYADDTRTGWIVLDAPDELAFVAFDADADHDLQWMWLVP